MRTKIVDLEINRFNPNIFELWDKTWFVLTSGNFKENDFNPMTVAWGSLGIMWQKPFVMVVVRPTRHTYQFINRFDTFSLCAFPEEFRNSLTLMGTLSGRDGNKTEKSGLTPIALHEIEAPGFAEADLTLACRKLYWEDLDPKKFLDENIDKHYEKKDYHRMVFGEILSICGDPGKYNR